MPQQPPSQAGTGVVETEVWFELHTFARVCGVDVAYVQTLVDEDLVLPAGDTPGWRFGSEALARVRRIRRLQRDFDANLQSVAVMLDLLDEIERLRAALRRAGIEA
jgi:chaperone modulatory protein CbpM